MVRSVALRSLLLLCGLALAFSDRFSAKQCEDLGFTSLALCSDCNTLAEYVKDEDLVSDCRKCCSEDSDNSLSKVTFSGAILEVCMRKLGFYPEIVAFIEEEKDEFSHVRVQYAYASPPKLIMLDSDGHHKETIRIDNWKRDHIRQFLKEKLKPNVASS
ncbi:Selenoprotein family protein [Rhynchospora pubera]|uniref:Selenoprotein F n=1 Tax=Rhynchospora pubera TaxID=906938 RepID=A0AAV8G405_9POAL|nr:Selenoprotein family protein [Rhynchospora pubera]KAJ4798834.1 Selenoprotein family protein [Rhynchospora pubera]